MNQLSMFAGAQPLVARNRTIKVNDGELRMLQKAREEITRYGYKDLEGSVEKGNLDRFLEGLALGAIAAIGAAALISLLTKRKGQG